MFIVQVSPIGHPPRFVVPLMPHSIPQSQFTVVPVTASSTHAGVPAPGAGVEAVHIASPPTGGVGFPVAGFVVVPQGSVQKPRVAVELSFTHIVAPVAGHV